MSTTLVMTVDEMNAVEGRAKWLEMRKTGIGGSDAGVIAGVNKWKSLYQLWLEKTNQLKEDAENVSEETKNRLYWGTALEELIANWFTEQTGKKLRRCGMMRSNEHPFMLADVDRVVIGENAIVECKTTATWNAGEWEDDNIPASYYCQVQHYMAVGGYDKCYMVCLIGGNTPIIREIERNEEDIAALIAAEEEFWSKYVVAKDMPMADGSDKCTAVLQKMYPGGGEEAVEMDGKFDALCDTICDLQEQAKTIDGLLKEKKNILRQEMGNAEFGRTQKYNVWYKVGHRAGIDIKALCRDYPNIADKYKTSTPYRNLRVAISKARTKEGIN